MASRVEPFTVTCPANTPPSAPIVIDTTFDIGIVERVEIFVPPGHVGLTGFQIRHSGAGVMPREDDRFIIADAEVIKWDFDDPPTAGRWAFRVFNNDVYEHSWFVRYLIRETGSFIPATTPPLKIVQPEQTTVSVEETGPPEAAGRTRY